MAKSKIKDLKNYQKAAIDELKSYFDIKIRQEGKQIIYKSPTGSGKTFIITKLIEDICQDIQYEDIKLSFIWISIGKGELHKQSYNKVKGELNGSPDCQLLTPAFIQSHECIEDRQIVFVNWEALISKANGTDEWKNTMMRDQEGRNFIELLDKTRENGSKIILIVDESHVGRGQESRISQFRREIVNPSLTIEMSATPTKDPDVETDIGDVIAEGMIKEELIVNSNIKAESDTTDKGVGEDTLTLVLEKAENQRQLLVENFKNVGTNVNPLVLVQIPNSDIGDETMELTENFLREKGISEENGLLVKWFTGDKNFDQKKLVKNNNPIEYLIFKTAVDTGWDCPRAHILVKFRDVQSNTAKIQTIGRILRTPEAKKYGNPILDKGYLFTNMEYIDPREDEYNQNHVKDIKVRVKEGLDKSLSGLESFYKSRVKSYNSATTDIYPIVEEEFCDYCGIKENEVFTDEKLEALGFVVDNLEFSQILAETNTDIDQLYAGVRIGGGENENASIRASSVEIRAHAEDIIANHLHGLAKSRSVSPIKQALAETLRKHVSGITRGNMMEYTLMFIVRNEEKIGKILDAAVLSFEEEYPDANADGSYNPYEISDEMWYSRYTYEEIKNHLSLYDKMYLPIEQSSNLEKRFLDELDIRYKDKIEWVWHNGYEPNVENFGIMIESNSPAFRPDFIIKFKDGRIGIFDTKPTGNYNIERTRTEAKALFDYIAENKAKEINVFGGIVIESNNSYFLNQNENYDSYEDNPNSFVNIRNVF